MASQGSIPFSRFMELALYCPNLGYYEQEKRVPGQHGDFFTSVSVGSLFGRLLAARCADWLEAITAGPVQLVEAGAHDGRLALDILSWCESQSLSCWPRLQYWILEPSPRRRDWQARTLARFADRVRWFDGPASLEPQSIHGVVFSNELFDAFPVTRLRWSASLSEWQELGVKALPTEFGWTILPVPSLPVNTLLADAGLLIPPELARVLPDGFTLDLTAGAGTWWRAAAEALAAGRLVTIDYGLKAEGFLNPSRVEGTLRAYRNHRMSADILASPGEQDLTSHVNFSQLQQAGETAGLASESLESQARFLQRIAVHHLKGSSPWEAAELRQFQTLTHPDHLGSRFQVLIQRR